MLILYLLVIVKFNLQLFVDLVHVLLLLVKNLSDY